MERKKVNRRNMILFSGVYLFYSLSGVLAKLSAKFEVLSTGFLLCYAGMVMIMGIYAVVWQQLLKTNPLSGVFMYKATTVIWGSVFGVLIFSEQITTGKILGILLIMLGIYHIGKSG